MRHLRRILVLVALLIGTTAPAQPLQPNKPAKYKVTLRYHIGLPRDPHVIAYRAMTKHVERLGFEYDSDPKYKRADTDPEDRSKNNLHGSIGADKALKLLDSPIVQAILLVPDGFDLPAGADDPVSVRLELGGKLAPDRQRELANQTRLLIGQIGFKEAIGYDHRGYTGRPQTRIVGTIPKSRLDLLIRDLRNHPAGWLGPILPREEIPLPLRDINPVQVVEVQPDGEKIKEIDDPPSRGENAFDKISPDLWELVKDKDVKTDRVRIEVGMVGKADMDDRGLRNRLRDAAADFFIEGQLGTFATGSIPLDQIKGLASSPSVNLIRRPRVTEVNVDAAVKIGDNAKALKQSRLEELHKRGYRGQGVRIAIIDRDFRAWENVLKKKYPKTRLVDLTTEADTEIDEKPYAGDKNVPGHGTLCAQAAALAATDAEIVLVRIDTVDPSSLFEVLRYVQGGRSSTTLDLRDGEIASKNAQLRNRRALLLEERKVILNDFTDDTDETFYLKDFLGGFYPWLYSDREWHRQRMEIHEKDEAKQRRREQRFAAHLKEVASLEGIGIVVNALSWHSGYPLGATSPLSKLLDDPKGPLWFQAVGNTRGQAWLGPYRSTPGDAALKFTDDDDQLPKGRWSNEINFLRWQPYQGDAADTLPDHTRLRITLQWREPHDPDYFQLDEADPYRRPLAGMKILLLRQRDEKAEKLPGDAFELTARTLSLPERIEHLPGGSVYEHVLETKLEKGGRFAVRIEKQLASRWVMGQHPVRKTPMFELLKNLTPTGIRPLGAPTLPALEKDWELRPRLFVEVIDDANRVKGRAVLDYATESGSIGLPADARNVISVGAASFKNLRQPYSAFGSPAGMELARRPWLYAYDELELAGSGAFGTSIANAFAAGATAAMLSGKLSRPELLDLLREQEGQVLRIPLGKR